MGAVPALGEHTEGILAEFGLTADELVQLRADGVIGIADSQPDPGGAAMRRDVVTEDHEAFRALVREFVEKEVVFVYAE